MSELGQRDLEERLGAVGAHLAAAGQRIAIVVVGGTAINLGGHAMRLTEDVDVYACVVGSGASERLVSAQPLPAALARAAATVARDFGMPPDWMNAVVSPRDLTGLPEAFVKELSWRRFGGLRVGVAGRRLLIALKLHAATDRDRSSVHFQDLLTLHPSDADLAAARAWVVQQDTGPAFPHLVDEVISHVRQARDLDT